MKATIELAELKSIAQKFGLDVFSVFNPGDSLPEAQKNHQAWLTEGKAAEMGYLTKAHTDLQTFFPPIKSAVVFAVKYTSTPKSPSKYGFGRVARYAHGKDYHKVLPKKLKALVAEVEILLGGKIQSKICSDANPLLEKALAAHIGLGFYGKNSLIIRPGIGSYTFLAEILWDIEIIGEAEKQIKTSCGSCSRCVANCPTKAITPEYSIDSRRCISYLTIEKRTTFTLEERSMLGDWLFGCDICQEVCPFNAAIAKKKPEPDLLEFSEQFGAGEFLALEDVLSIKTDQDYCDRFAGTPLMRAKREGLIRNAICVAVNTKFILAVEKLEKLEREDTAVSIRNYATWGVEELVKNNQL